MARLTNFPNGVESAEGFYGPLHGSVINDDITALTPIATADATDPATTMALANECKAKINAIIAALKA